ncbi:hypothetical protein EN812_18170 [Mesorhizobium sp. M4B.F.Ca.ET.169.01.1.1]|uniref:hypothetical protein n=1 Tax=unclassified Mesorhizobium TaxID=325217 RepID=UPI000FC9A02C|nr:MULTISPECIES: hypothetical protein [unclassified Mesorhizobium]RVD43460.1 hypothetical protein EN741_09875 [Mesorhizobium sp. M4B.F.Ca.ET.019.03.1.1]TGT41929.1 hypothetical protein EN812_18170 [Mesorhizobium sp. M4B.F.Ca.ET.169.01.1.1]
MIAAFLVNRIPARPVVETAAGGLAVRVGSEGWQDKGPRCAVRSVGCFLMVFVSLCDVLAQFAMCTLAAFSRFAMEIAPRGLSAYES